MWTATFSSKRGRGRWNYQQQHAFGIHPQTKSDELHSAFENIYSPHENAFIVSDVGHGLSSENIPIIEKRFSCSLCPYSCDINRDMKLHMRTHTGEKPFPCPYCDYRCAVKRNMKKHISRKHSTGKPFACPHCTYRAPLKEDLKCHMLTHERPFKCHLCPFSSFMEHQLQKHILQNHS